MTAQAKSARDPFLAAFLAKASKLFRNTRGGMTPAGVQAASMHTVKHINGSESTVDEGGRITKLRDAEGRCWSFTYAADAVVAFTDFHGCTWVMESGRWMQRGGSKASDIPRHVRVTQTTGEVVVEDDLRRTTYRPDGSTVIHVTRLLSGSPVTVAFTEYPTRPAKAFVVCEEQEGRACVTWIQDANGKLYKFEWDKGLLCRFIDVSRSPSVVWHAQRNSVGKIVAWHGKLKLGGASVGALQPVLEDLDVAGNRYFVSSDGKRFIVQPSGAAISEQLVKDQAVSSSQGIISLAALNANLPDPF